MLLYLLRRIVLTVPTFIGITLMVFAVTRIVPGGPVERMLSQAAMGHGEGKNSAAGRGQPGSAGLSEDQIKELEAYYGFDKPVWQSYLLWIGKVLRLDLGHSTRYNEPVWEMIRDRFPISIYYGVLTLILTYLICIPLGIAKAIYHHSAMDNVTSIIVFLGYAVPGFVFGIFLLVTFSSNLEWFPLGGFVGDDFKDLSVFGKARDLFMHSALPLAAYMVGSLAVMTFMMKNSLLDNLAADYVRTAIAKGITFRGAVFRHALRNSLVPIVTHIGSNISLVLTGSFLIEKIFNINGFGLLGLDSVVERDYPVVMGILTISSVLYLIGNILSDLCVALVDPRVKFE